MQESCNFCGHARDSHGEDTPQLFTDGKLEVCVTGCPCTSFVSPTLEVIKNLPMGLRDIIACAEYLGIDPGVITSVKETVGTDNFYDGLMVSIQIPTGRQFHVWQEAHLPSKWKVREVVAKFVAKQSAVKV